MIGGIGSRLVKGRIVNLRKPLNPFLGTPLRQNFIKNKNISYSRCYSTKQNSGSAKEQLPSFKKILLIAIVGTGIFVQAVRSLDKNQPKTSYSELEYHQVINGLKRKVILFQPGELELKFTTIPDVNSAKKRISNNSDTKFINPSEIVDQHRNDDDDRYKALLENIFAVYGKDYVYNLPEGLLVSLLGDYIKENVNVGDKVIIVDFPQTIKDASHFESEVAVVNKVVIPKKDSETDICKYFKTVDKVDLV